MSEAKFTPGPWTITGRYCIRGPRDEGQPWQRNNPPVARVRSKQEYRSSDGEIDAANARLIAAAPEMYEALEKIMEIYYSGAMPTEATLRDINRIAKAALAKAEGC